MVLEAEKSQLTVPADSLPGEGKVLGHSHLFTVSSHGGGGERALRDLLYKGTNSTDAGSILIT